ncbi:lipopolysaccharide export system permease protein [Lysobacter ruishenii]|uniref:Lipopolysaccharide export system permease protein n=2 Tax=Aerolutibacter ruishenii TaxID=686800 RepID=A0A562M2Q5_9GAMM|nr:LPS export ABC transporter permease LptG [Lysobacter ruishenii]TWI14225.1 lipopolysaccharide export system permease protein [Lysobacter ruishenii]
MAVFGRAFPKIHDLYLGRAVLGSVLLTWAVLLGLDLMLGLVSEVGDIGKGNYDFPKAVAYMAFGTPWRAYNLFPTAAVIGALMALGQLAASSELTALRAVGLSRRRLSLTVAGALAVLTLAMVVNGETLAPWGQRQAAALKASAKSNDLIVARYSGLWAREGAVILNAGGGDERDNGQDRWLELRDVSLYEFEPDGRLKSMAVAKVAEHRPGGWLLRDVTRTAFGERSVSRQQVAQERWESRLDTAALTAGMAKPRYMPSPEVKAVIDYRQRNGLDAGDFEEVYWGRWFYALNALALVLAAIPFAFGSLRSGGLGKRLFIGIVFALAFWLLQTQFVRLAQVYKFDFRLAYLLPTLIMVMVSMALFHRRSG